MANVQPLGAAAAYSTLAGQRLVAAEQDSLPRRLAVAVAQPSSVAPAIGDDRAQNGVESRIHQLERDVTALNSRLLNDCGIGDDTDGALEKFVKRLEAGVLTERRMRDDLANRMRQVEEVVLAERKERDVQLRTFSSELEATMQGLVNRIDEGLSAGAATMRERTDQTEARLRALIERVDAGLSASAAALQDTLENSGSAPAEAFPRAGEYDALGKTHDLMATTTLLLPRESSTQQQPSTEDVPSQNAPSSFQPGSRSLRPANGPVSQGAKATDVRPSPSAGASALGLRSGAQSSSQKSISAQRALDGVRKEEHRLGQQRLPVQGTRSPELARPALVKTSASTGISPNCTPSMAVPSTLQVPGSGLGSAAPPGAFASRSQGGTPASIAGVMANARVIR